MSKVKFDNIITEKEVKKLFYKLEEKSGVDKKRGRRSKIQDRAIIYSSLFAGLKATELIKLEVGDVDLNRKIISSFGRKIPFNESLKRAIDDQLSYKKRRSPSEANFIFPTTRARQSVYHAFKRWAKDVNLSERYSIQSCRHYYIISLIKKGINPVDISRRSGVEFNTLEKYYLLLDKNMDEFKERKTTKHRKGYVYVLKNKNGEYKIGCSKDPQERVSNIDGTNRILTLIKTKHRWRLESYLHDKYSSKNIKGEWFNLSKEDLDDIKKIKNKDIETNILDYKF